MTIKIQVLLIVGISVHVSAQDYAHFLHSTTWADYLCYDKQHARAQSWYQDIISDPIPYPLRSYSLYLFDTQQYGSLLSYKKHLQDFFKNDLQIQKAIAVALAHEKQDVEAEQLFVALAEQFPASYEVTLPAAQILIRRGEDARAQGMLEKIINTRSQKQVTSFCMVLLAQLYIKGQNIEGAYGLMTQCTAYQPSYAPAWLILGTLEELKQNRQGALQAYRTFCSLSPVQVPEIEKRIAALQLGQPAQSKLSATKPHDAQTLMFLIAQKKYTEALPLVKQALYEAPQEATLRALYVHLLVITGSYPSAIALLAGYIHEQPHDYRWWGALHILAVNPESSRVAQDTLKQARLQYPHSTWGYLYEADLAMRVGFFKSAHDLCMQASSITTDEVQISELYFMQALCGYEMHDYTIVEYAIQKGLASSVVHAPLYNLAAYYYAHTGDYMRAQELIVSCCAMEPLNYHYQDTAAFIAYKKNDLQNAEKIFTALRTEHATDATILLHAASVARKQDNSEHARALLAQAENHAYSEYVKRRLQSYLQAGMV